LIAVTRFDRVVDVDYQYMVCFCANVIAASVRMVAAGRMGGAFAANSRAG
jgi:hypothetical protein